MLKSMTAYSRLSKQTKEGFFLIELFSLNRRSLDISIGIPDIFSLFEIEIRKWIGTSISRGQINLRLSWDNQKRDISSIADFKEMQKNWEQIAHALNYDSKTAVTLSFLADQYSKKERYSFLSKEKEEEWRIILKNLIEEALQQLLEMKKREGAFLEQEILVHLNQVIEHLNSIQKRAGASTEIYREKLLQRLQDWLESAQDPRLLKEVAFFAERSDITEEIARLQSHIDQFQKLLISEEKSVGRTLDFLIQEMAREINTLGVKSPDPTGASSVLAIKAEIEKMREQIQNVE
jgi:uncharacterized protein (TIGR00255 family)